MPTLKEKLILLRMHTIEEAIKSGRSGETEE